METLEEVGNDNIRGTITQTQLLVLKPEYNTYKRQDMEHIGRVEETVFKVGGRPLEGVGELKHLGRVHFTQI